jgi:hypothetical protein
MVYKSFLVLVIFGFIGNIHAATVGISPSPAVVTLGESFSLDVVASDFDVVLDGGGLNIHYDPAIVQLNSTSVDTTVWDPQISGINGGIDNASGDVTGIFFNSLEDITGDFTIATLNFTATATGVSPLQLSSYDMNPFASGGTVTPVSLENGSINVVATAVPLPAAAWFMISGLGLLIGWGRRHIAPSNTKISI